MNPTEDTPTPEDYDTLSLKVWLLKNKVKQDDTQLLGILITEISEFGGGSEGDYYKLARILLPHINAWTAAAQIQLVSELEGELPEKREKTTEKTYKDYDRNNPRHRYVTGVDVGHNHAIGLVQVLLEHKKQELEGKMK